MVLGADDRDPNPSSTGPPDPVGPTRATGVAPPAPEPLAAVITAPVPFPSPSVARIAAGGTGCGACAVAGAWTDAWHQTLHPSCPFPDETVVPAAPPGPDPYQDRPPSAASAKHISRQPNDEICSQVIRTVLPRATSQTRNCSVAGTFLKTCTPSRGPFSRVKAYKPRKENQSHAKLSF